MESEETEIKSKQASKRDRTLSSQHNVTNSLIYNSQIHIFFSLKNGDGDWKAAKSPKKSVRGGSSGRGRGRPKGSTNSKFFNEFQQKKIHIFLTFPACF